MERTAQPRPKPTRVSDVQDRGRELQHRFRVAGIPQYTRWLIDHDPALGSDVKPMVRMRLLFNGKGSMTDVELLEKCEALADKHLPRAYPMQPAA